jgi:penicillin-binding protein 1A
MLTIAMPTWVRRLLRIVRQFLRVVIIVAISAVTVPVAAAATIIGSLIFLPLPATLPTPKLTVTSIPSTVYDAQGNKIATFRVFEQQLPVKQSDIPTVLKEAVVASEDRNFYHHGGVDPRGSLRALVADLRGKGYIQGGSTIAQQYVKNAYTDKKRTLSRKLKEAILASQLARQLPKDEILFKYLDSIYFGDGAYGVGAASETYFHHPVNQLTLGEAALLVGLIPAPSRYEPRANGTLAEQRRQTVLKKMLDQGYATPDQYHVALVSQVFAADEYHLLPKGSPATLVYPAQQDPVKYPYFVDYVRRWLELDPRIGPTLLYRGGLQIQTTIDEDLQAKAEKAVNDTLSGTSEPLEMALVSVEPQTGFVMDMVGGRDFSVDQTNLALGGCEPVPANVTVVVTATCKDGNTPQGGGTGRQPGSAFKAFTLATAFERGVQPSEVFAAPACFRPPGATAKNVICNAEPNGFGSLPLRSATWYSVNTVFAQLILDRRVGVEAVARMAQKLGITSAWYSPQVHGASYTLGAVGVSPLDMASAYGVFDNHGLRVSPTPVALVEDPVTKKLLIDNRKAAGAQVIDPAIADNVTDVLRGVISQPGATGTAANIGRPAAGKTGTTTDYHDAWFVGYVPTLSTSVWMGNKDKETHSLRGTKGVTQVFGGTFPARTWQAFMTEAVKNVPVTDFSQPAPLKPVTDQLDRTQRQGIDPGGQRYPADIGPGGPYEVGPAPPQAVAPTTTTSTTVPTSGASTTIPGGQGGGTGGAGGGGPPGTTSPTPGGT